MTDVADEGLRLPCTTSALAPLRCRIPKAPRRPAPDHRTAGFRMRFTASILGFELDVTFGPATEAATEDDPAAALSGGTLATQFVGFAVHVAPEEIPLPQRTPAWDDEDRSS